MFKETNRRSVIKSITFRVLIVLCDSIIIYALTKKVATTIAITILTNIASTIVYFLHERFWNRIRWGKTRAH